MESISRNNDGNNDVKNDNNNSIDNLIYFLKQAFKKSYAIMNCKHTNMKEIENIIKSLKSKNSLVMMRSPQRF